MEQKALSLPVSMFMHQVEPLRLDMSLQNAAALMHRCKSSVLPVVSDANELLGVLYDTDVLRAFEEGTNLYANIQRVLWREPITIRASTPCGEALDILVANEPSPLIVVDELNYPLGIVSAADILGRIPNELRPKLVGGMATPLGVYLTNGALWGGAPPYALIFTGALLFTAFMIAHLLSFFLIQQAISASLISSAAASYTSALALLLFLLMIRFSPLAGTHAAEHMVVHAIERGEKLIPEIVSKMPRVHPRCGTNLAVGIGLFLGITHAQWFKDPEVNLIMAAILTIFLWRPIGNLTQFLITTKTPTKKQIANGIAAGKDLIKKYQQTPIYDPPFITRLATSGIFHIILGSMLAYFLLGLILTLLNVPKLY